MKLLLISLLFVSVLCGCSGRNIHTELSADPSVLVRQWARPTRSSFIAGERDAEYSNAVISENTLIFGNQSIGLISIYPMMNQVRWILPITDGIHSRVAVSGGTAFFGANDGFLYAVDAENGRVKWKYEVRNPLISQPTVAAGRLYITTSDDTVMAFDAGTGEWLWHFRRRSSLSATIHGASQPLIDGNEVITGFSDGFLVGISVNDGKLKWEKKLHQGVKFTDVDAHPILESGIIYVPSYDGALYALDRKSQQVLWRYDAGGGQQVVLEGNVLYLSSSDGYVYAIQKNSGKVIWKFELDRGVPTQAVVTEKHVIFGSSFQYLYAVDKSTGKGLYRYNVGYGCGFYGVPIYDQSKRRLYLLSGEGILYAFSTIPSNLKHFRHAVAKPYIFDPMSAKRSEEL